VPREDCSFTVLAYGYQAELARRLLSRLALEEEIFGELVVPSQISPLDWEPIHASVNVTRSLLVIEESVEGFTWGSEVAARISSRFFGELRRPVATAASDPTVIPSSKTLEAEMLMTPERVERAIRQVAA
jgi:pyruvate dehydrogenase E1 component beta subunit